MTEQGDEMPVRIWADLCCRYRCDHGTWESDHDPADATEYIRVDHDRELREQLFRDLMGTTTRIGLTDRRSIPAELIVRLAAYLRGDTQ
jgi:hypothetical protein